jgi:hypothetical protein
MTIGHRFGNQLGIDSGHGMGIGVWIALGLVGHDNNIERASMSEGLEKGLHSMEIHFYN